MHYFISILHTSFDGAILELPYYRTLFLFDCVNKLPENTIWKMLFWNTFLQWNHMWVIVCLLNYTVSTHYQKLKITRDLSLSKKQRKSVWNSKKFEDHKFETLFDQQLRRMQEELAKPIGVCQWALIRSLQASRFIHKAGLCCAKSFNIEWRFCRSDLQMMINS